MSDYIKSREYIAEMKTRIKTASALAFVAFAVSATLVFLIPAFVRWFSSTYEAHVLPAAIQFAHALRVGAINAQIGISENGLLIAASAGALIAAAVFALYFVVLRFAAKDKQRNAQPGPRR